MERMEGGLDRGYKVPYISRMPTRQEALMIRYSKRGTCASPKRRTSRVLTYDTDHILPPIL